MSTTNEATATANNQILYLLPEQIGEPETTNVRPFSTRAGDTEAEIAAIEALSRSIADEGQLQPIRVKHVPDAKADAPQYQLIAGRRRRRAVLMHNLALSAGESPILLECVVSDEDIKAPKMFRQAAHENLQREGLSPMDFAMCIQTVRTKFKWQKDTFKVAKFFEVSPATILQHEKLLVLPEDLQMKVHNGDISRDDAFKLVAIQEKSGPEAAKTALKNAEAAEAEALGGVGDGGGDGDGGDGGADTGADSDSDNAPVTGSKKKAPAKSTKSAATKKAAKAVKSAAIKKAAEEHGIKTPRNRKTILEFFASCKGPVYGYPDGAVHKFVDNFLLWADGSITDRTLEKYFDAMVEKADKGTKESVEKAEAAEKAAKEAKGGKSAGVDKGATKKKAASTSTTATAKKKK